MQLEWYLFFLKISKIASSDVVSMETRRNMKKRNALSIHSFWASWRISWFHSDLLLWVPTYFWYLSGIALKILKTAINLRLHAKRTVKCETTNRWLRTIRPATRLVPYSPHRSPNYRGHSRQVTRELLQLQKTTRAPRKDYNYREQCKQHIIVPRL